MAKQPLRGVNLGGWLVLERWISPSLFAATSAADEFSYCDQANPKQIAALKRHHKTWVTRQDFQWLAEQGFDAVRIPVGYWIFGDAAPYVGSITYLDKAFVWAEECGLKILICMHGAAGSQNGQDHSGRQGSVGWVDSQQAAPHVWRTLNSVERLAERYKDNAALLGIELLNEPASSVPRSLLTSYYRRGYRSVRRICGPKVWVVFSDRFKPRRWWWVLHWPMRVNAVQDNHQYQIYTPADKALDLAGHLAKTARISRQLRIIGWHRKLIIGEWSAALDPQSLAGLAPAQLDDAYKGYLGAQLRAYSGTEGWFYWTYKTEELGPWNLRDMVERGTFPPVG